jgi:hypothetical protein
MRASAAALFTLTGSGLGSGIGPLLVGDLTTRLAPSHGDLAVRWALVWITSALALTGFTCLFAARNFRQDLEKGKQELTVDPEELTPAAADSDDD